MDYHEITFLRDKYTLKYRSARSQILLLSVFTVLNIILLLLKTNLYFLFTAEIPYFLVVLGLMLTGHYEDTGAEITGEYFSNGFLYTTIGIAAVIIILYIVCFLCTKKINTGWFVTATVFFTIDTVFCIWNTIGYFDLSSIINILFHIWVMYYLISGIVYSEKIKKILAEIDVIPSEYHTEILGGQDSPAQDEYALNPDDFKTE